VERWIASLRSHDGGEFRDLVIPAKAGIQYTATYRFDHCCLWNTGSPACAG